MLFNPGSKVEVNWWFKVVYLPVLWVTLYDSLVLISIPTPRIELWSLSLLNDPLPWRPPYPLHVCMCICVCVCVSVTSLVAQMVKASAYNAGDMGLIPGLGRSLGEGTHSSTLAWKIPWMEEPSRLQSTGLQRIGHDWATSLWLSLCVSVWKRLEGDQIKYLLKQHCPVEM